jgi:hypothetical protein
MSVVTAPKSAALAYATYSPASGTMMWCGTGRLIKDMHQHWVDWPLSDA